MTYAAGSLKNKTDDLDSRDERGWIEEVRLIFNITNIVKFVKPERKSGITMLSRARLIKILRVTTEPLR